MWHFQQTSSRSRRYAGELWQLALWKFPWGRDQKYIASCSRSVQRNWDLWDWTYLRLNHRDTGIKPESNITRRLNQQYLKMLQRDFFVMDKEHIFIIASLLLRFVITQSKNMWKTIVATERSLVWFSRGDPCGLLASLTMNRSLTYISILSRI